MYRNVYILFKHYYHHCPHTSMHPLLGIAVNQNINRGAAKTQKFMTITNSKTNMATVEKVFLMYLLHKRQKWRQYGAVVGEAVTNIAFFFKKFRHCYFFIVSDQSNTIPTASNGLYL